MIAAKTLYEATDRQDLFHHAPEMFKLYGGAMGGGKTVALCAEGIALSNDYPGNRGYICRHTLTSFKKTTFLVLDAMLQRSSLIAKHNQSDHVYSLRNGSTIFYGGLGDDTNAIEALKSMELGWFGIDEASETTEKFFLMLASRLRLKLPNIQYFGIMATNPDPGWLKQRFIDRHDPNHVFIPALPKDNPYLPADYVERLRAVFPDDWQARFIEGDWAAFEGTSNVFPYQAIQAAVERDLPEGKPIEDGVDVARYGDDESVIAVRKGPVGRIKKTFRENDLMQLTGEIIQAKAEDKAEALKVDADGMGGGVVDRLREQGHAVVEIHGGGKASNSEKFKNSKAEIHWAFRDRLIAGDIDLPDDLELKAQLTSITYRVTSSGQLEITPKEEMKRKGLKSPDRAEAMIYAFAQDTSPKAGFLMTENSLY
jgi:PBSX family phage terminase large subunit